VADRLVGTWGAFFCPQEAPENFLALAERDCQQFCQEDYNLDKADRKV
jgi:hypothetical protein